MINIEKIDDIYRRYGYDIAEENGVKVYKYNQGRYFGVDIFDYNQTQQASKIQEEYSNLGYAVLIRNYVSCEEVELELFKSFFNAKHFKHLINLRYEDFTKRQTIAMPNTARYEYIKCAYNSMKYDEDGFPIFENSQEGDSVVEQVANLVSKMTDKPLFVIIEAAAGFGKTCSSYELLHNINSQNQDIVPMYIELSRNREARIFKHILLNEINLQFQHSISADIVVHEIKQGRIPLIIDGFDELLSKDLTKKDSQFRDAESILTTLIELLDSKAKIIITSRRTAIFNGDEFFEWMQRSSNKYNVARYSLSVPDINNWLDKSQIDVLKTHQFPINNISNPVLLSYLRNMPQQELEKLFSDDMAIIDKYFEFILNRERSRQNFTFTNEEQLRILRKLVRIMTEFDIKSENKTFIKDIIKEFNADLLESYIRKSPITPKPTIDELADTLSNHALLDRKQNDEIGFINEFIMGLLIGQNIVLKKYQEHSPKTYASIITQEFATLAISSYIAESNNDKKLLLDAFADKSFKYSADFNIYKDISLQNKIAGNYSASSIVNLTVTDVKFTDQCTFDDFVFSDCTFTNCIFSQQIRFHNSGFVNCKFYDCEWIEPEEIQGEIDKQAYFSGCIANNTFLNIDDQAEFVSSITVTTPIEQLILEYFIRDGRKYKDMVNLSKMRDDFADQKKAFDKAINTMENQKLLALNGGKCFLLREGVIYYRDNYYHN